MSFVKLLRTLFYGIPPVAASRFYGDIGKLENKLTGKN